MEISQEYLKSRLSYDPESGVFTWKARSGQAQWNSRHAGKIAGTAQKKGNGYRRISITLEGRFFKAHRLAWLYMTGEQPPVEIDHKNRDATDNRWENIRDSEGLNQKNKSMQRNNKSGVTGVSWSKPSGKWCARVWCGTGADKCYKHLGLFTSVEAARKIVDAFREGMYDPQHGKYRATYISEA